MVEFSTKFRRRVMAVKKRMDRYRELGPVVRQVEEEVEN
jgi:hypothetical protein